MAAVESPRTVQATAKFVHTSPRKARLVADLIRNRSVPEARTILAFTQRAAARDMNSGFDIGDEMFVEGFLGHLIERRCLVDRGVVY